MAAKEKTHVPAAAILGGTRIWASLIAALIVLGAICNIAQADTLAAALVAENSPLGLGRNSGAICVGVEAIQARRTHQENARFLGDFASDDGYATKGAKAPSLLPPGLVGGARSMKRSEQHASRPVSNRAV